LSRRGFPGQNASYQANRDLAQSGLAGILYFGWILGLAVLTEVSTPFLYTGLTLAAAEGFRWAAAAGIGFGLGRSVPVLVGLLGSGRDADPHRLALTIRYGLPRVRLALLSVVTVVGGLAMVFAIRTDL
jgi:hypothetical protein